MPLQALKVLVLVLLLISRGLDVVTPVIFGVAFNVDKVAIIDNMNVIRGNLLRLRIING